MSLKTTALLYNFLCFALLYAMTYFLIIQFTGLSGLWRPVTATFVAILLAPKFQAIKTATGENLFMSWLFIKGVRKIK